MIAKPMTELWPLLGVEPSRSRPHVSNDNPFSEAAFKTLKYHLTFPGRFADLRQATVWMRAFDRWYNWRHAHTGLGLMTPAALHFGFAEAIFARARDKGLKPPRLVPIKASQYPARARRPANSELDCAKIVKAFGVSRPPWRESLLPVVDALIA